MADINKHNYEAYWLDFLEGNLNADDAQALQAFFMQHPEIKPEAFNVDEFSLNPESIAFENKSALQRDENIPELSVQDALLIGLLENTLSGKQKTEAETLIQTNRHAAEDYKLYQQTRLIANTDICYQGKHTLKRKIITRAFLIKYVSVAAVFLGLVLGLVFLRLTPQSDNLANNTQPKPANDFEQTIVLHQNNATVGNFVDVSKSHGGMAYCDINSRGLSTGSALSGTLVFSSVEESRFVDDDTESLVIKPLNIKETTPPEDNFLASTPTVEYISYSRMPKSMDLTLTQSEMLRIEPLSLRQPKNKMPDWSNFNITYIKETTPENTAKHFALQDARNKLDSTRQSFNPILKLREAKEELLAINVQEIIKNKMSN